VARIGKDVTTYLPYVEAVRKLNFEGTPYDVISDEEKMLIYAQGAVSVSPPIKLLIQVVPMIRMKSII